ALPREPTRTAGTGYGQVAAATLVREQVPAPDGFDEIMPKTLATATVDRLMHHAHIVVTQGDSYRLTQATSGQGVKPFS
ncbi:ATP-binding protein, partial [Streptomyces sp. NPDC001393]